MTPIDTFHLGLSERKASSVGGPRVRLGMIVLAAKSSGEPERRTLD